MYVRLLLSRAGVFLSSLGHCYNEGPALLFTGNFSGIALVADIFVSLCANTIRGTMQTCTSTTKSTRQSCS